MDTTRLALRFGETARSLGISPRTLFSWVKTGRIPHTKVGKVILFSIDELRKWLASQSRGVERADIACGFTTDVESARDKGPWQTAEDRTNEY
jgi:excisionase family DNA binding protein